MEELSAEERVSIRHIDLIFTEQMLTYIGHRKPSARDEHGRNSRDISAHGTRDRNAGQSVNTISFKYL
jgi:hypothetical protein